MTRATIAKAASFSYTDEEKDALASAVPDVSGEISPDDIARSVHRDQQEMLRRDKKGHIARSLEQAARECFVEENSPRPIGENVSAVRRIAKLAKELRTLLLRPNRRAGRFAVSFFGYEVDQYESYSGDHLFAEDLIVELLDEIEQRAPVVEDGFRRMYEDDEALKKHSPGLHRFTSQALAYWSYWANDTPGAGKQGGPAARFLMAASNPVIAFAKKELGVNLRRKGALNEQAAAEIISGHRKAWLSRGGKSQKKI